MKTLIPLIIFLSDTTIEITTPKVEIEIENGQSIVIELDKVQLEIDTSGIRNLP